MADIGWVDWGSELIWAVGFTSGGAPYGLRVSDFDPADLQAGAGRCGIRRRRATSGRKLTGGGTSLIGEPSSPATAPILYTNGPVGTILAGNEQAWASEVANNSDETFTYRQFALCAESRIKHQR